MKIYIKLKFNILMYFILTFLLLNIITSCKHNTAAGNMTIINISIDIDTKTIKQISPFIYGVNVSPERFKATAYRSGGNRTTGYNWENNLSNAGEDWHHFNDEYLVPKGKDGSIPAITITDFIEKAKKNDAYAMITLPMAGYVANDNKREVKLEETAPSARFAKIIDRKNAALSLTPDLNDGVVYSDEFINFLTNRFGTADKGGINGYSLDNEPALWAFTHPRIHPQKVTVKEILEKSISLSSVVKDIDPAADVFGPALYGVGAYANFQDAPDWKDFSKDYVWFIDAYLDGMRKAEEKNGRRLLDVLDVHYYTEARCALNHRICDDRSNEENCIHTRFQSTRTLWDWLYRENSWVQQSLNKFLPVLPRLNASIEKYYPGTKLAITEYNFGYENHISGGIAQADALGIFAANGLYLATLWPISDDLSYAFAGINLYINYDGKGARFGGMLVNSSTNNVEYSSVYASTAEDGTLHIILLNKSQKNAESFTINIDSDISYKTFTSYGFDASGSVIKLIGTGKIRKDNTLVIDVPALSAYHLVVK